MSHIFSTIAFIRGLFLITDMDQNTVHAILLNYLMWLKLNHELKNKTNKKQHDLRVWNIIHKMFISASDLSPPTPLSTPSPSPITSLSSLLSSQSLPAHPPPWYNRTGWLGVKSQLTYPAHPYPYNIVLAIIMTWDRQTSLLKYLKSERVQLLKWQVTLH